MKHLMETVPNGGTACGPDERLPHSVTASALPPGSREVARGQSTSVAVPVRYCGSLRTATGKGRRALRVGPQVVLGQDLTEAAGPVGHSAMADLATGNRQVGNRQVSGRRETCSLDPMMPAQPE